MKVAFLTEMNWQGKVPANHNNMRTEFAWMRALDADHFNIHSYPVVQGYDAVFIIFPKATVKLNAVGVEMVTSGQDRDITIYSTPIITTLKDHNGKVCYVQEGPSWFFNDYDMVTQFNFYNQLSECDIIFAHNINDIDFYKGLFPQTKVSNIPSLMYAPEGLLPIKEDKAIIGGNFARWYGGFQSYVVATEFQCPIFVPASHCKRNGEEQVPGLTHLPWVMWTDWMKQLSTFKYAVNLMPTVAAGTFTMNCAYFGIPCIGNECLDTQDTLFPQLSIDVEDVHQARFLAKQLQRDQHFYDSISAYARSRLKESYHLDVKLWKEHVYKVLNG